jgi:hypothetical protein
MGSGKTCQACESLLILAALYRMKPLRLEKGSQIETGLGTQ